MKFFLKLTSKILFASVMIPTVLMAEGFPTREMTMPYEPKDSNQIKVDITADGSSSDNRPVTPDLIGRDPSKPDFTKEFIDGTKWKIKVVGYQKSSTISKGKIISQKPKSYHRVNNEGEIKVIISSGN